MFVPCFVVQCFMSFLVYNHLYEDERERAGCFTLFVFLLYCDCYCSEALPHSAVGLSVV